MLRKSIPPFEQAEPIAPREVLALLHEWLHPGDGAAHRAADPIDAPGDEGDDVE